MTGRFKKWQKQRTRTFSEHLEHLARLADLQPGERVIVPLSGRTGTIVKKAGRHNGWRVKWDEPKFGVETGDVSTSSLDRLTEAGS